MGKVISLRSHKYEKAAVMGFREWRRLFEPVADFDRHTRWADLPDEVVAYLCEENPESRHSFYDLIMRSRGPGTGHDFESQPHDRLTLLLNAYFFITDQARFECMRRLGWLKRIPRENQSILEVILESEDYDYPALLETPEPTPAHPACAEYFKSRDIERPALVRQSFPEAIRRFKTELENKTSARERTVHGRDGVDSPNSESHQGVPE